MSPFNKSIAVPRGVSVPRTPRGSSQEIPRSQPLLDRAVSLVSIWYRNLVEQIATTLRHANADGNLWPGTRLLEVQIPGDSLLATHRTTELPNALGRIHRNGCPDSA